MNDELREFNAWIAENVMGLPPEYVVMKRGLFYRPDDKGYTHKMSEAGRYTLEQAKEREYPHDDPVTYKPWECSNYTTDPAAAMQVLKKCVEMRGEVKIFKAGDGEWVCRKPIGSGYNSTLHIATATTLELAICRFARKLFEKQ
jgi:Phage ABA sandwich domain